MSAHMKKDPQKKPIHNTCGFKKTRVKRPCTCTLHLYINGGKKIMGGGGRVVCICDQS